MKGQISFKYGCIVTIQYLHKYASPVFKITFDSISFSNMKAFYVDLAVYFKIFDIIMIAIWKCGIFLLNCIVKMILHSTIVMCS